MNNSKSNKTHGQQGGSHEQNVKAGQHSHDKDKKTGDNPSKAGHDSSSKSSGEQSGKNADKSSHATREDSGATSGNKTRGQKGGSDSA